MGVCNDGYFLASTCQEPTNSTYLDFLFQSEDGLGEFEIIVEIDDDSLLEDADFLEELIYEVEEMVYLEALLSMDDVYSEDDIFSMMYLLGDNSDDFNDLISYASDLSWEDDSYYYPDDSYYYGAYFDDSYDPYGDDS